jgi:hypothetical protein
MRPAELKSGNSFHRGMPFFFWMTICMSGLVLLWYLSFEPGFEGHHENANALVLISLDQWLSQGPQAAHFAPALSYPGKNNAFIGGSGVRLFSETGTGFYTSAGAYSIWLPYLFLQLPFFSLSPEIVIHLLALANIVLTTLLLFLLVQRHTSPAVALYASIYFLFQPLISQLGTHLWSWDSGWLLPWLALLSLTSSSCEKFSGLYKGLVSLTALLAGYNDHQGVVLVAAHIGTMFLFRRHCSVIIPTIGGLLASVLITEISYAQIAGLSNLLTSQQGRFAARMLNGFGDVRFDVLAFSAALVAVPLLSCLPYKRSHLSVGKPWIGLTMPIVSSLSGSLLDFILFPQWHETHYFSLIKWTIPLTLFAAIWMEKISFARRYYRCILLISLLAMANILSLTVRQGSSPQNSKNLGLLLKERSPMDHALGVVTPNLLWAPVVYNAKRNIMQVSSTDEFQRWMKLHDIQQGRVLFLEKEKIVKSEEVIIFAERKPPEGQYSIFAE